MNKESTGRQHTHSYRTYHPLVHQAILLGRHHKVVRIVPVVHDILQVDPRVLFEVLEELLVENEGHTTDLVARSLLACTVVLEVGGDGQGQLSPQLLPVKAWDAALLAISAHQDVKVELVDEVVCGLEAGVPAEGLVRFQYFDKLDLRVDGDPEKETYLEEDALEGANAWGG